MKWVGIIVAGLILSGCAGSKMEPMKTTYMPDGSTVVEQDPLSIAENSRMQAVLKCEEARKAEAEAEKARAAQAARAPVCPPGMSEVGCMAMQFSHSQAQTLSTVMTFAGKIAGKPEPTCADIVGKGLFDYKIAEVHEMNESARSVGGNVVDALKAGFLTWFGVKAVEHAGDEATQVVNGDESSPSMVGRTVSEQNGTAFGEDSPINQGGGAAPAVDPTVPVVPGVETVPTVDTAN